MTEQESQETKDAALLKCVRLKQRMEVARARLNQTAEQLESVAHVLRSPSRSGFLFEPRPWLNPSALTQMIRDLDQAEREFAEANAIAIGLGEGIV